MFWYSLRVASLIACSTALILETNPVQACGDQSRIIRSRSLNESDSSSPKFLTSARFQAIANLPLQQQSNFFRTKDQPPSGLSSTNLAHISWSSRELPYPGDRNERAGCRGAALADGEDGLRALVPATGYGLTTAEAPTLFFYVPQTVDLPIEFTLMNEQGDVLYQVAFTLPKQAGIVPINLSTLTRDVSLEVGQLYYWFFAIITDPADRSGDHLVSGWVERVEPGPTLMANSTAIPTREQSLRYAQSGVWYDALMAIATLRHTAPNNLEYTNDWQELLESVGLAYLANQPFLELQPVSSP